jgi:hypothetical protein
MDGLALALRCGVVAVRNHQAGAGIIITQIAVPRNYFSARGRRDGARGVPGQPWRGRCLSSSVVNRHGLRVHRARRKFLASTMIIYSPLPPLYHSLFFRK